MFRYVIVCFGVLTSVCSHLTDEQKVKLHTALKPIAMKCLSDLELPMDEFDNFQGTKDPTLIDPCFLACIFKASGVIDEEGMYKSQASGLVRQIIETDENADKIRQVEEDCMTVNKEDVSDGTKGCERASKLAMCFKAHV